MKVLCMEFFLVKLKGIMNLVSSILLHLFYNKIKSQARVSIVSPFLVLINFLCNCVFLVNCLCKYKNDLILVLEIIMEV